MKLKPGRIVSVTIVVSWAVLVATHVWKTYAPSARAVTIEITAPVGAGLTERGVFYRGVRMGYLRERTITSGRGLRAEQEGRFALNVMGRKRTVDITGGAELGDNGELETFTFRLDTSAGFSSFTTEVEGRIERNELVLAIRSGGRERTERRTLREPIVIPIYLYRSVAAQGLETGKSYRIRLFDPMTLGEGEAEITVLEPEVIRWGDREEEALRLRTRFAGLTTTAWVNREGEVLKEETPLGWTLLKEVPGSALGTPALETVPEVLGSSAIPALGFAGEPGKLRRVHLRLNQFPPLDEVVDGGRQRLSGRDIYIEVEEIPLSGSAVLPEDDRLRWLASDAFVQADDPEIRELAQSLVEGLPPLEAARTLSAWVHDNVQKTPTLSVPSAREVLEQRAGDCNEHTVLFTALARAAGIPSRIATGLAWSAGQFYYHAWAEVWTGGWVAVDPTFGQFPADPLHVRLLIGGIEKQYEVLKFLGRGATIQVLETE